MGGVVKRDSCPGDTPDDFGVDPMDEAPNLARRKRMRWQQKLLAVASGTAVAIAEFDKVNGALVLARPATAQNLS